MVKKFSELKESTKNELIELFDTDDYKPAEEMEEIKIDLDKDLSDFSNLSDKTKTELAELAAIDGYDNASGAEQLNPAGFDGNRILRIHEFIAGEQRKMKEFLSRQEQEQASLDKEFADSELMKKNLGMQDESIEHNFRKAEMFVSGSEKEKKLAEYISSANTLSEQIDRTLEIRGRQDIKAQLLNVLKLDKEKKYYK